MKMTELAGMAAFVASLGMGRLVEPTSAPEWDPEWDPKRRKRPVFQAPPRESFTSERPLTKRQKRRKRGKKGD
jgi:hypothetical protein